MKNDIKALLESSGPLPVDQLADQLGVLKAKNFTELIKLISKMESRRELVFTRDGRVGLPPKKEKKPKSLKVLDFSSFRAETLISNSLFN